MYVNFWPLLVCANKGNPRGNFTRTEEVLTTTLRADGVVLLTNILIASSCVKEDKSTSKYPSDEECDEDVVEGSVFLFTYISTVPYNIDVLMERDDTPTPGCSNTA